MGDEIYPNTVKTIDLLNTYLTPYHLLEAMFS